MYTHRRFCIAVARSDAGRCPTQEVRESQGNSQALAFACPMCEHARGGVSNFACPPSPGETSGFGGVVVNGDGDAFGREVFVLVLGFSSMLSPMFRRVTAKLSLLLRGTPGLETVVVSLFLSVRVYRVWKADYAPPKVSVCTKFSTRYVCPLYCDDWVGSGVLALFVFVFCCRECLPCSVGLPAS